MPKPTLRASAEIEALIAAIAREDLGVETLETRNSDALDFHEVAVWSLREALMKAFHAARATAARQ
jgi:hypothetical protein